MKSHKNTTLLFLLLISLASFSYGQSPTDLQCYAVEGGYSAVGEKSGLITIDLVAGTVSWQDQIFLSQGYGPAVYDIDEFKLARISASGEAERDQNWIFALEKLNMGVLAINRQSGELLFTGFSLQGSGSDPLGPRLGIHNSKHICEVQTNLF